MNVRIRGDGLRGPPLILGTPKLAFVRPMEHQHEAATVSLLDGSIFSFR